MAVLGCGGPAPTPTPTADARVTVHVGEAPWEVLVAGPDGMRRRTDFGGADGMLFDLGRVVGASAVGFVMDGVTLPLAIAWFDGDGLLVGTAVMAPCAASPCPVTRAPGRYRWAIEAPVGAFDDVSPDARLRLD